MVRGVAGGGGSGEETKEQPACDLQGNRKIREFIALVSNAQKRAGSSLLVTRLCESPQCQGGT